MLVNGWVKEYLISLGAILFCVGWYSFCEYMEGREEGGCITRAIANFWH